MADTPYVPDLERLRETNERFLEASRKLGTAYLDGIERYVSGLTQFERKLGDHAQVEPVADLLSAHAKLTDDVTKASVAVARELVG